MNRIKRSGKRSKTNTQRCDRGCANHRGMVKVCLHSGSDEELGRSDLDTSDSAQFLRRRTSKVKLQAIIVRRDCRN